jgi:hypothetical protein
MGKSECVCTVVRIGLMVVQKHVVSLQGTANIKNASLLENLWKAPRSSDSLYTYDCKEAQTFCLL